MLNLRDFTEMFLSPEYHRNYVNAKASGTCIRCGRPAEVFKNASSSLEYHVSALCQNCQDELFTKH